jgi:hypothetical protein
MSIFKTKRRLFYTKNPVKLFAMANKDPIKAVTKSPYALAHVKHITPEIAEIALEKDGICLRSVPMHLRDVSLCTKAVMSNSEAIKYVPKNILEELKETVDY